MSGTDDEEAAQEIKKQLTLLLSSGGFELRKWASNSSRLLEDIPAEHRELRVSFDLEEDEFVKTLGMHWHPKNDTFFFKVPIKDKEDILTKRSFLSKIARLFDPIGWLTPAFVLAKIMLQQLWLAGIAWDDTVPENISQTWYQLKKELKFFESVQIPRWIGTRANLGSVQLYGFCDASMSAYCAVVYVRTVNENDDVNVTFLVSKSKVAPVKPTTLPRLELCGAALLGKLMHKVIYSMKFESVKTFAWTDSMITLSWIRGKPNQWKTFVCNRVALIQEYIDCSAWRYVSTKDNPADYGSRGCLPSALIQNSCWWNGPKWLHLSEKHWPVQNSEVHLKEVNHERKAKVKVFFSQPIPIIDIEDFSTLHRLLKVTALCYRFIKNCRNGKRAKKDVLLEADDIRQALYFWIKQSQTTAFQKEINDLNVGNCIHQKSPLLTLTPFICEEGLLRVGGRLQHSNLGFNRKHPIILPKTHHLTKLIVKQAHLLTLHGGPQLMEAYLRKTYWIPQSRNIIRKTVHECLICFRYKKLSNNQLMGSLPAPRLNTSRAFMHTGVDYAGPISIRMSKGRGAKILKGYIAIFICLCTKAIHLEPVSDQTTESFLAAFRRFTARRGLCSDLYSDCGTNFVGASNVLQKELYQVLRNVPKEAAVSRLFKELSGISYPRLHHTLEDYGRPV